MNRLLTTVLLLSSAAAVSAQMADFKGHKDPALFTRMPHYFLTAEDSVTDKAFDAFEFQLKSGSEKVEGRHLHYEYTFDEAAGNMPGMLQINAQMSANVAAGNSVPVRITIGEVPSQDLVTLAVQIALKSWRSIDRKNARKRVG